MDDLNKADNQKHVLNNANIGTEPQNGGQKDKTNLVIEKNMPKKLKFALEKEPAIFTVYAVNYGRLCQMCGSFYGRCFCHLPYQA